MKISRLFRLGSALVLTLSTLLSVYVPSAHALSICTWSGADSGNSLGLDDASNYTGCGTIDGTSILIFPAGSVSSHNPQLLGNLTVADITFQGDNYDITSSSGSNTLTVAGDITTSTSSVVGNEIDANIALTSNTPTVSGNVGSQLTIGSGSDTLSTSTANVTLANVLLNDPVQGSGSLTVDDANYPASSQGVQLAAANPGYTGAVTITNGALFVEDAAGLTNASSVTVNGGLLKGNGGLSSAIIQSGGTVAPGDSPGCLTATNMTISGTYAAEIGGATACTGYDQLQVSGSTTISGTLQISFVNGFTPTVGQSFTLISNSGSLSGTFNGLADGETFTSGGATFQITYTGGSGNDVVVTVITPPTSSGDAEDDAAAPDAPDTGLASLATHPWTTLAITSLAALSLAAIARRLKPAQD